MNKRDQIIDVLKEELQLKELELDLDFRNIQSWSSLTALLLMARLREEFKVVIHSTDLAKFNTLQDLIEFVEK
jgi:acyl carrier protein